MLKVEWIYPTRPVQDRTGVVRAWIRLGEGITGV
jgi:hypothetical protein